MIVNIYGPRQSGKTFNAQWLKEYYGCRRVVEWDSGPIRLQDGDLVLSLEPLDAEPLKIDGLHQIKIADALLSMNTLAATGATAGKPQMAATEQQVGGSHYTTMKIQPLEYCMANEMNACQTKIIKYVSRRKGDKTKQLEDLDKAIHVLQYYKEWIAQND